MVPTTHLPEASSTLEELCKTIDGNLFTAALTVPGHVLN